MASNMTIEEQLQKIQNSFPLIIRNDYILYLFGDIERVYKKNKGNFYYLNLIDNDGYKYKTEYKHVLNHVVTRRYNMLNRFFSGNIYTYENINNFCIKNNIDLRIEDKNLPLTGYSRNKLPFVSSDKKVKYITWNALNKNTFRYKQNYAENLIKAKEQKSLSKEDVISIIYKMQNIKGKPLNIYDFYPKQKDGIGIRIIRKYWGELWIMQKELGLKITGKYGSILTNNEVIDEINQICKYIADKKNRKIISNKDFSLYGTYYDGEKYNQVCKEEFHMDLREYIKSIGYIYQKCGNGMNYTFTNGEKTLSYYEYEFSNFLRNNGFIYNNTYFRDYKYSLIDNEYNGKMNCDYKILINNKWIYIELAGILKNKEHEIAYKNNIPIKSKSKELYRQKLIQKREIFERNNIPYYILLPSEMTIESYKKILNQHIEGVI